jgi:hypothetical protein
MHSSEHAELAAIGRAVRAAYVEEPPVAIADAHISAILAEAERVAAAGADRVAAPDARRPRVVVFRLAAVVASAFVASAGLALAGVRPPEPVSDLFEGIGIDVPGSDESTDEATPTGPDGATQGRAPGAREDDGPASEEPAGGDERRSTQGDSASSEGQATAQEAQNGGAPPNEPGRSEDHPDPPAAGAEQSQGAELPEQSQAGEGEAPASSDDAGAPQTLTDPGVAPEPSAAPGLAVSQDRRPVEAPGKPGEPAPTGDAVVD